MFSLLFRLFPNRHANLILNLFALMVDANVPDIALEPDKTVKKVILSPCQILWGYSEVVTGRDTIVRRGHCF